MDREQARQLLNRYLDGECSEEERAMVEDWYAQAPYTTGSPGEQQIYGAQKSVWEGLRPHRRGWKPVIYKIAAAAILGGIVLTYLSWTRPASQDHSIPESAASAIRPGNNKAMLTLADGSRIALDHTKRLTTTQPGVQIIQENQGELVYKATADAVHSGRNQSRQSFNTLSTPNGSQYQIRLPDGTNVWLNAGSQLIFPVSFAGSKQRVIRLKGEAYFEVAKMYSQAQGLTNKQAVPFIVQTMNQTVEVLGTHFDIKAYHDEETIKTTLLEGSVRVSALQGNIDKESAPLQKLLKPGQQAILDGNGLSVRPADLKEAIAWKQGYFRFNNIDIKNVMMQLARWYDIEAHYIGEPTKDLFNGVISRNKSINEVLRMLERTNTVHFKIEGRRIVVMP